MTDQPRKRITIDAPDGSTILAARHLDATEGRAWVGSTIDTSTRSAIDRVLGYVARAHNQTGLAGCGHEAELDRLTAELADYDERAEQQKQRADEAEQHLRNIAQGGPRADAVQAEIGEMIRQTHELRDQLRRAEVELRQHAENESADAVAGSYAGRAEARLERVRDLARNAQESGDAIWPDDLLTLLDEAEQPVRTTSDNPSTSENTPDNPLEEQVRAAVESEMYEYRERTMWWPEETGGVTKEIARLATRGAMEALGLTEPAPPAPRDPCPHCEASSDRIPRAEMGQHIADVHPDIHAKPPKEPPCTAESLPQKSPGISPPEDTPTP